MKPGLLVSIIAAIALVIAGAATIVLAANQPERPRDYSYTRETRDPSLPPACMHRFEISFRTDAEMIKASDSLENDRRFYNPSFMTQAQNYERLKQTFANQPEVLKLLREDTVPATGTLFPSYSDPGNTRELIEELRREYGSARVTDPCETPSSSRRPVPTTATSATRPSR
ncbi:hypothetical protein ALI144C_32925 [Actinosynnema sp. ALI-1.44]|uniref:hypothetical protein n=1 Tax=Actinosynnema sp. ALI-1.44 TaxID=1933779 RepID=UPI00097C312A|nr:hypothetical protein [Actinosynnema sp. ALI-1.44]ONI76929.1 hypothetical protein ALI144C_32925 [Actinosynnema sp. ALI-1.44]